MSDLEALMRRYYEQVWTRGDQAAADELLAEDYCDHTPPPFASPDRAGHAQAVHALHAAFPDLHVVAEDIIAQDNRVVARWRMQGTHRGDFFGMAPTGKAIKLTGVDIAYVRNGKIAEMWHVEDLLGLQRQLQAP